jgi:flagellar protein FliS
MRNTSGSPAMQQYQQIETKSEIEGASPHRLIQLMMNRVLAKIAMARGYMDRENVSEKGAAIGSAISIVDGLRVSLNHKTDARLAGNFDALYDYMNRRLLEANLKNDPGILIEVSDLMREIKEAWDSIGDQVNSRQQSQSAN